ncbi:MAG: ribokinase [Propionibacteriaceae bacterium]|nr:ribokinase [Propionibacteriaceae bacterium]
MTVYVVGSVNLDVFLDVPHLPQPGETIAGDGPFHAHGGKGMNQAVACAMTGATTALVGCVGTDAAGTELIEFASRAGVDTGAVGRVPQPTGMAHIFRSAQGENTIVITTGANREVTAAGVASALAVLQPGDVVVVQGEIDIAASEAAVACAEACVARVMVNLAPVVPFSAAKLAVADPLVLNEVEAAHLVGLDVEEVLAQPMALGERLLALARSAVVTLGSAGAVIFTVDATHAAPAPSDVSVVDSTGAGDAFVGVLASHLSRGMPLADAAARAVKAASRTVGFAGAADSYAEAITKG